MSVNNTPLHKESYHTNADSVICVNEVLSWECNVNMIGLHLVPAYNEFSYNKHPPTTSSFLCIFLLVVSGTQCTYVTSSVTASTQL